jgi:enamine deaminase RidA (YjgF/YER057c/UK114 family)
MSGQKTPIISSKVANPLPDIFPHAVKAGGLVFVSGSIGLDETSNMVEGGIQERTVSTLLSIDRTTRRRRRL